MRACFVAAPKGYVGGTLRVPPDVRVLRRPGRDLDFVQAFVTTPAELDRALDRLEPRLTADGMLWISWPKKASEIDTSVDGNLVRVQGLATGLVDVKVCAVDETWSGLKFVRRRADRG